MVNVAQATAAVLQNFGVSQVFGNPGTTEVPLLDTLSSYGIAFHLCLQEGVAVAMADGYGRTKGGVGVVLVHTAVGTAMALTNLINAWSDGRPILVIAGEKDSRLQGRGHVAEVADLPGLVRQVTKFAVTAGRAEQVPELVARAMQAASAPPAGPVFVAVPEDAWTVPLPDDFVLSGLRPTLLTTAEPAPEAITAAVDLLNRARSPLLVVGDEVGLSGDLAPAVALAEQLIAPVSDGLLHAIMATNFPRRHPLYHGPLRPGAPTLQAADVVVALGCRLFREYSPAERDLLPPSAHLIHISRHAAELGRLYPARLAIPADPNRTALCLSRALAANPAPDPIQAERRQRLRQLAPANYPRYQPRLAADARPDIVELLAALEAVLPAAAVIVDESVLSTFFLHQGFGFTTPGSYVSSSGAGLGWGPGAALGAALGQERPVICLVGDGSALFSIQALWTAAHLKSRVVFVVLNNGGYMAVRKALGAYGGQAVTTGHYDGWQVSAPAVDFPALARALGVEARSAERTADLVPSLQHALQTPGPSVLDVHLDPAPYLAPAEQ